MKLSNKIFLGIGFFDRTNNVLTDNVIHRPLTSYEHFQLQLRRKILHVTKMSSFGRESCNRDDFKAKNYLYTIERI